MIARIGARVAEGKAVILLTITAAMRASRKMWHENQRAQSPEGPRSVEQAQTYKGQNRLRGHQDDNNPNRSFSA